MKSEKLVHLSTKYEKLLKESEIPFSEYPRPQLKRQNYLNLNGKWGLKIVDKQGDKKFDGKILVPFMPRRAISWRFSGRNVLSPLMRKYFEKAVAF